MVTLGKITIISYNFVASIAIAASGFVKTMAGSRLYKNVAISTVLIYHI
jgi:hypothetical protein